MNKKEKKQAKKETMNSLTKIEKVINLLGGRWNNDKNKEPIKILIELTNDIIMDFTDNKRI